MPWMKDEHGAFRGFNRRREGTFARVSQLRAGKIRQFEQAVPDGRIENDIGRIDVGV